MVLSQKFTTATKRRRVSEYRLKHKGNGIVRLEKSETRRRVPESSIVCHAAALATWSVAARKGQASPGSQEESWWQTKAKKSGRF